MKPIETELQRVMIEFISNHKDNLSRITWEELGGYDKFIKDLGENIQDVTWALTELLDWGMDKKYNRDFIGQRCGEIHWGDSIEHSSYYTAVYKITDSEGNPRFFILDHLKDMGIVEVIPEEVIIKKDIWKVK